MIEIKDLLAQFGTVLLKEEVKKETTRKIISEVIHLDIKTEDMSIKNGTIYLNIKPIYKSEILRKREKIDELLTLALLKKNPYDIR